MPANPSTYFPGLHRGGRRPGQKNKFPVSMRRELNRVFELCGGTNGLWQWASANPNEFYPLCIKALGAYEIKEVDTSEQIQIIIAAPSPKVASPSVPELSCATGTEGPPPGSCGRAGVVVREPDAGTRISSGAHNSGPEE